DLEGDVGLDRTLDLYGACDVEKSMVRKGFFKKLVSNILPDNDRGYHFHVRIGGSFEQPDVKVKAGRAVTDGLQDTVKDTGNKVEKFFKKVF
ncbi:MAG TPA: hypothetical protein PLQ76_07480, partial [bacterium]|nr:hypothetical protein [bacterium]